jgi:hypothetical protein
MSSDSGTSSGSSGTNSGSSGTSSGSSSGTCRGRGGDEGGGGGVNHRELKAMASEFLLSGPPELDVHSVSATARELLVEMQAASDHSVLKQRMTEVSRRAAELLQALDSPDTDIMGEFRHLSSLVLQEQLLLTASSIDELKNAEALETYPVTVKKILKNCPKVMPPQSKISSYLNTTVSEIKKSLLSDFHKNFECHLVKSEELSSTYNSSGSATTSWESFFSSARSWMLAFAMVSLLPSAARGGGAKQLLEGFQECLDAAFTPLWGRFFFHLSSSRDAGSMEQILWTFEYTHTFVHLLLGFCSHLTAGNSDLVLTFPGVLFRQAGEAQIIEKTCRFMRSHVAECLVILNPAPLHSATYTSSSAQICMSLIEHSLLLDHDIHKVQHGISDVADSLRTGGILKFEKTQLALPVSAVFCANHIVRNLWLHFDHEYFLRCLQQSLGVKRAQHGRMAKKYANSLDDDLDRDFSAPAFVSSDDEDLFEDYFVNPISGSLQRRCSGCVYDCLVLFHKAYQRYSYIPPETQDLFSAYVLEPLLLSALGLIMFRTNTNASLKLIFDCRRLPLNVSPGSMPEEGLAIIDTVNFLEEFLLDECTSSAPVDGVSDLSCLLEDDAAKFLSQKFCGTITPPSRRFADNWSLLQAWVRTPDRRYITQKIGKSSMQSAGRSRGNSSDHNDSATVNNTAMSLGLQGFRAYDVVEKAFSLAEETGRKLRDKGKKSFDINSKDKKCDLADVLNFARKESTAMANKLQSLLDTVVSKSIDNDIYLR